MGELQKELSKHYTKLRMLVCMACGHKPIYEHVGVYSDPWYTLLDERNKVKYIGDNKFVVACIRCSNEWYEKGYSSNGD